MLEIASFGFGKKRYYMHIQFIVCVNRIGIRFVLQKRKNLYLFMIRFQNEANLGRCLRPLF